MTGWFRWLLNKSNIDIILSSSSTMNANKTTLNALKEITAHCEPDEDETLSSRLAFDTLHIETRKLSFGKMTLLRFENLELKVNELQISDCEHCILG
jgi:hypothetical protein